MTLFDEYAARFARGERPDLREYLSRAGEGADELAQLVDGFLARAEPPEPDKEAVARMQEWLPLVQVRTRRRLRRVEVVDALIERFGLDPAKRKKVERYYHEVETGQRIPADERLVVALGEVLRTSVSELLAWRPRPPAAQPAYYRANEPQPVAPAAPAAEEPDDIDDLFRTR